MIRCCVSCARKLEQCNIVTDEGDDTRGVCPLCYRETVTHAWEITPRRVRYSRSAGGGGERGGWASPPALFCGERSDERNLHHRVSEVPGKRFPMKVRLS